MHHSWGFWPQHHNISDYIRCEIAATSDIVLFFPSIWRLYYKYFYFSIAFYYSTMLHYVYIKFRAWYFHYVSVPTEILSHDFISEFHLLFQQRLLRFLMKLLVHRSFQWFPALIQLHFHRTNLCCSDFWNSRRTTGYHSADLWHCPLSGTWLQCW